VHKPTLTSRMVARHGRLFHLFDDGTTLPVIRGGDGESVPLSDLIAQAADPSTLDDDALATLDADITAAAEALAAEGVTSDEQLAELTQAGEAVQAIRAEQETREVAAADRAAQAEATLALIRGEQEGEGDEGEPDEGDPEGDEEAGDGGAEEAPEVEEAVEVPAPEAEAEVEPIAASAPPARNPLRAPARPATPARVRRPASTTPRPSVTAGGSLGSLGLVASANAPGVNAGERITDYDQLAAAFMSAVEATKGYTQGPRVKVRIARSGMGDTQYPEGFRLGRDEVTNMGRIEAAQDAVQRAHGVQAAITASGGICAPQQVNYDMPTVGATDRPTRDGFMMRFGADRGGVRTLPMPLLGDLDAAVDVWTEANDVTPSDPATKPCLTVTCPEEDETVVEAITRCLEYGNFRARFFPEQIEAWMRLATVTQARFAEERLLAAIGTGSTAVTVGQILGTTRSVLAGLDKALSVWRYRHRLPDSFSLAWAAPRWLRDNIRTDIARQLPVGSTAETLAVADAEIERWFAVRNVEPTWLMDGESGQRFVVQAAGPLQPWPTDVRTYLAPAGSWLFLDGGTLDLGIVRDSTLNSTNDVQVFAETFEGAHFHGIESWVLTFDTCPDGSVSSTVDIDPCSSGS